MKYKQSPDFMLKRVSEDDVLIARGKAALKVNGVFIFNETCSFLWKNLEEPISIEELTDLFRNKYGIDKDTASFDLKVCMREMLKNEMIVTVEE